MTEKQEVATTTTSGYWKPLDFCDLVFPRPFHVLRQNWAAFLTIALLASGLRALLAFVFDVANGPNYGADYGAEVDYGNSYGDDDYQQTGTEMDAATITMSLVNSLILFVAMCLADGACIYVVANLYAGQPPFSALIAIGAVAEKIVPLVGSCLLVSTGLFVVCFALVLIIFLIIANGGNAMGTYFFLMVVFFGVSLYVSIVTYLMYPAIVVENKGVVDSIKRSIQLTEGCLGKILAMLMIYGLLKMALGTVIVAVTISNTQAAFIVRGLLSFCLNTFFLAIGAM